MYEDDVEYFLNLASQIDTEVRSYDAELAVH